MRWKSGFVAIVGEVNGEDEGKYKQNCVWKVFDVVYYYLVGLEVEILEDRKGMI